LILQILFSRSKIYELDKWVLDCQDCKVNIIVPEEPTESRHRALLEAAVGVFSRFGYRKTSMDDIARAADVSRQCLYLSFSNKEELFRRAVEFALSSQLSAAVAVLSRSGTSVEQRLIAACEAWVGRFAGSQGADAADLMCAGNTLAGEVLSGYGARFEAALADALAASSLAKRCLHAGVCQKELSRVLHATVRGLKQTSKSREEFLTGISTAVRMLCAPPR
jgi:AcrR family transcriptional regulator